MSDSRVVCLAPHVDDISFPAYPGWAARIVHGAPIPGESSWSALVYESINEGGATPALTHDLIDRLGGYLPEKGSVFSVPPAFFSAPPLVMTDVDSTLIQQEVIEELAHHAGTRAEVAAITARAMNGEIDFARSLYERVNTLKGLPISLFNRVLDSITPTPGAQILIDAIHASGGYFGVVSGGFEEVVAPLCQQMGIDHYVANRLEVEGGYLTGRVLGDVVTAQTKVEKVHEWAALHGTEAARVLTIGDGANDVPMLHTSGLGVAFCAKPAVREQVAAQVNLQRLDAVMACWG